MNRPIKTICFFTLVLLVGIFLLSDKETQVVTKYTGDKATGPPKISLRSVGRPRFASKGGAEMFTGTGFLLEHKRGPIMVGAYHCLKSASGLDKKGIQPSLRSKIEILAVPLLKPLKVRNQRVTSFSTESIEGNRARGDLSGFFVTDLHKKAKPLKVSKRDAYLDEPVWVAQLKGPPAKPSGVQLVAGKVAYHSNKVLVIKMDGQDTRNTSSGAPVVNAQGEVVGVMSGFTSKGSDYYRIAVPGLSVRNMLEDN